MILYLKNAEYRGKYHFWLEFNTGESGEVDLSDVLCNAPGDLGKTFQSDKQAVQQFYLDAWPTLAWSCGYDIAPEKLYEIFIEQNREVAENHTQYKSGDES